MITLGEMFDQFERDAWRLEVRDDYAVPREEDNIRRWRRTGVVDQRTPATSPWLARAARTVTRGAYIGRVRLVGHPLTDYTRWELATFAGNAAAGEDIRIVDRTWINKTWDNAPDFWIFDDRIVYLMRYSSTGEFLGAETTENVAPYIELRRRITPASVPLADYRPDIPAPRAATTPVTLPNGVLAARE